MKLNFKFTFPFLFVVAVFPDATWGSSGASSPRSAAGTRRSRSQSGQSGRSLPLIAFHNCLDRHNRRVRRPNRGCQRYQCYQCRPANLREINETIETRRPCLFAGRSGDDDNNLAHCTSIGETPVTHVPLYNIFDHLPNTPFTPTTPTTPTTQTATTPTTQTTPTTPTIFHFFLPSLSSATVPPPLPDTTNPYVLLGLVDPYDLHSINSHVKVSKDQTSIFNIGDLDEAEWKEFNESRISGSKKTEAKMSDMSFPTMEEIKRAYHRLVRIYHPDSNQYQNIDRLDLPHHDRLDRQDRHAREVQFERINEAYMKLIASGGRYDTSAEEDTMAIETPATQSPQSISGRNNKRRRYGSYGSYGSDRCVISTAITPRRERATFPWSTWNPQFQSRRGELMIIPHIPQITHGATGQTERTEQTEQTERDPMWEMQDLQMLHAILAEKGGRESNAIHSSLEYFDGDRDSATSKKNFDPSLVRIINRQILHRSRHGMESQY